ncbi:hypothetical protein EJB05_01132, partial [Eragrostis curvula]
MSCCDAAADAELREQFQAMIMNVSDDDACAAAIKDTLCTMRCSPSPSTEYSNVQPAAVDIAHSLPHLLCGSSAPSSANRRLNTELGMCLEKISGGSFVNLAGHPDGSARVFLSSHDGKIWLASVPANGHALHIDYGSRPFLDLTDRLRYDAALGLRGLAFHPEFSTNGRFFVAYTCDSALPACGQCFLVPAAGSRGLKPCRYQLVVAEYRAGGGGGVDYSKEEPSEVRRIFSIGLSEPRTHHSYRHHGGQLLFKHSDGSNGGHLYLIMGEEFVSSKNKRPPVGKIIRFDVDRSTPMAEIYALGLANPSGCSFDSERPSHLYCANVDQHQHEQVYLISDKTGRRMRSGSVSLVVGHYGRPAGGRMPSIVGGLVYRGSADPLLVGRYLYMHGSAAWESSAGRDTSARIPNVGCSGSTPLACRAGIDGRVVSFGEDNNKDVYVLTTRGVHRVVHPDLCEERATPLPQPKPMRTWLLCLVIALGFVFYRIYSVMLRDNGGMTFCSGCCSNWFVTYNNFTAQPHDS